MDVKERVEAIVTKIKKDKDFAKKFKADPMNAVKSIIGVDLPTDQLSNIVNGVKAKVSIDDTKNLFGKAKGFFNK